MVYLSLYEVANIPLHVQGDELLYQQENHNIL